MRRENYFRKFFEFFLDPSMRPWRPWVSVVVLFILSLIFSFGGCIGGGGGSGLSDSLTGAGQTATSFYGKISLPGAALNGGIPIEARSVANRAITRAQTDDSGNFTFGVLAAGLYDFYAITADAEILFKKSAQTTGASPQNLGEFSLLGLRQVVLLNVATSSAALQFRSNQPCYSSVEFGEIGIDPIILNVNQQYATRHEIQLSGLAPGKSYECRIHLKTNDGQELTYFGLVIYTSLTVGPTNYSVAINDGNFETRIPDVQVTLQADNAVNMRFGETEDLSSTAWLAFTNSYAFSFSNKIDGKKKLYVQFQDVNGNQSPVMEDSIILNSSGYSGVLIESGKPYTSLRDVTISFFFPGATQMNISNDSSFINAFWETFSPTRNYRLSSGDGQKTVYVHFQGGKADPAAVYTASIILDTNPPNGAMLINNGAKKTATSSVTLNFRFLETPLSMQITNDAAPGATETWRTYVNPRSWVLSAGAGTKTVYAQFRDAALNVYGPISASIEIDNVPPVGNSATIRATESPTSSTASAAVVASLPVWLHLTIADSLTESAQFYVVTAPSASAPVDPTLYTSVGKPFPPSSLDASKFLAKYNTIWVRFLDEIGNISSATSVSFTLDGPRLTVSPSTVVARSGDQVQFTTQAEQTVGDIGGINWFLKGPGTLLNGKYTAPTLIATNTTAYITARSSYQPVDVVGYATVLLRPRVELAYYDDATALDTSFSALAYTLGYGANKSFRITVYNSTSPFEIYEFPSGGIAEITGDQVLASDNKYLASLTYSAPSAGAGAASSTVRIRPIENPSGSGTFVFTVDTFPIMNLAPTQVANATAGMAVHIKANLQSNKTETIQWTISGAGSFSPSSPVQTTNTTSIHEIDFYGDDLETQYQAKVTATILNTTPVKAQSCTITVTPPVKVQIFSNVILTTTFASDTANTVAEVGKVQFYAKVTPKEIGDTSVQWTVNGGAGGTTLGTIDANGLYKAPDTVAITSVKVRATSNFAPAYKEITVNLSNFWVQVQNNMTDFITGTPMPIYSVFVNPYTASGSDFQVYAGTNGYGLFRSTLPDKPGNIDQSAWTSISGLATSTYQTSGKFIVNSLIIRQDSQELYAGTSDGLYFVDNSLIATQVVATGSAAPLAADDQNFLSLAFGRTPDTIFAATSKSVYKLTMDGDKIHFASSTLLLDTIDQIHRDEARTGTDPVTLIYPTTDNSYSYFGFPNPINAVLKGILYDVQNDRFYAGGENDRVDVNKGARFLSLLQTQQGNLFKGITRWQSSTNTNLNKIFDPNAYAQTNLSVDFGNNGGAVKVFLGLAIDPNTPSTLWAATTSGVFRSVDYGLNWLPKAFTGSTVNTKCIIVDPTNVINVMSGSEDGLYRSTDAGTTWKQIKSGLGNHKTINSLTQAGGAAGARRRVWVGTTGGVFVGKQSLDLE